MARAETGIRERKKRATRAQLEEAAYSLFAQQGYDATTVEAISEAAHVSPRTFFRYFATKEDVVFGAEQNDRSQLEEALVQGPASDGEVLTHALLAFSGFLDERRDNVLDTRRLVDDNPALHGRVLQQEHDWVGTVASVLAERAGRTAPTFEQQVLSACAIGVLTTAMREWADSGAQEPLASFTQRALETVGSLFG